MANTFPEPMQRLDLNDVYHSLVILQDYITYITERTDFAISNIGKSSAALEARITALEARVTALENA